MKGRIISPGKTQGIALVSEEPMSFYGGVDANTGEVIEKGHALEGQCIKDRILVFPQGKGSTVGSYVIYGLKKNGVAPKAILNEETETIVATGVILAGIPCIDGIEIRGVKTGDMLTVDADRGMVEIIQKRVDDAQKNTIK
jgi:predicted aconitase with swiveling domain